VKNASFFPTKDEALRAKMVDLNPDDPGGIGIAPIGGMPSQVGVTGCFGGQGLFMPANEYVKMLRSLLVNDGKLLQGKSMELLFAPSLEPEAHTFVSTTLAEIMATSPLGAGLPKESKRDYSLGGLLAQQDQPGWYRDGTITWFVDRKTGLCGFGAPQPYLRDAPFTRGESYTYKEHRPGAMRWEESTAQFKQLFREGIYKAYDAWQKKS
jgi:hypothetical protein